LACRQCGFYFLAASWVHTLLTDKVVSWLDAKALRRMSKLDLHRMASGPGGQAMLDTFHKMHKATEVFPWTIVVKDVIRRDTQTHAARQVHVHLDQGSSSVIFPKRIRAYLIRVYTRTLEVFLP